MTNYKDAYLLAWKCTVMWKNVLQIYIVLISFSISFDAGRKRGGGKREGERVGREGKGEGVEGYIPMLNMGHGIMNEFHKVFDYILYF